MPVEYLTRLSSSPVDEEWDSFLTGAENGDLLQSTHWATFKQRAGWSAQRLVLTDSGRIVAGAQILSRSLPLGLGSIAYVPRGPVLATDSPELATHVADELKAVARKERQRLLFVQPPHGSHVIEGALSARQYRPATIAIAPRSTVRVDLRPSADEILGQMRASTRKGVRRFERRGMEIRQGTVADLKIFMRLHESSSERQGFSTASEDYYSHLWQVFGTSNQVVLLISEFEGEPVSAMFAVGFARTIWAKRFGWSGEQRDRSPNEGLVWSVMQWGKAHGYHWFDHDGVKMAAVTAMLNDEPMPPSVRGSANEFKLGFGGEPLLFPGTVVYVPNAVLRFVYLSVVPRLSRWRLTKKLIGRARLG